MGNEQEKNTEFDTHLPFTSDACTAKTCSFTSTTMSYDFLCDKYWMTASARMCVCVHVSVLSTRVLSVVFCTNSFSFHLFFEKSNWIQHRIFPSIHVIMIVIKRKEWNNKRNKRSTMMIVMILLFSFHFISILLIPSYESVNHVHSVRRTTSVFTESKTHKKCFRFKNHKWKKTRYKCIKKKQW